MTELSKQHGEVVWLAINSTNPDSRDFLKPAEYKAYNDEHGVRYPVLYDASGAVGHAYGAKTTPHMFIIDSKGTLVYNGAIDDGSPSKVGKTNYVEAALAQTTKGESVSNATNKPYGCSVKYGKQGS